MTALGAPRLHLLETASTNDDARELALAGAPSGSLVTASAQTAGRGRRGRTWSAPAGQAVLMSVVLHDAPRLITLRAAVATAAACGADAQIKWPNDVLIGDRKVAGILCERRNGSDPVIVGIGVNVAVRAEDLPAELVQTAGTLGRSPSEIEPFLSALLRELDAALALLDDELIERWSARDALKGRNVEWDGGSGTASGVDSEGRLLVQLDGGGIATLDAGEVSVTSLVVTGSGDERAK